MYWDLDSSQPSIDLHHVWAGPCWAVSHPIFFPSNNAASTSFAQQRFTVVSCLNCAPHLRQSRRPTLSEKSISLESNELPLQYMHLKGSLVLAVAFWVVSCSNSVPQLWQPRRPALCGISGSVEVEELPLQCMHCESGFRYKRSLWWVFFWVGLVSSRALFAVLRVVGAIFLTSLETKGGASDRFGGLPCRYQWSFCM